MTTHQQLDLGESLGGRDRLEMLRKYNVPGPRYTSYPTVPYWEGTPTQAEYISSIQRALTESHEGQGIGSALYIHIPFCKALCTYCGCNTRIVRNRDVAAPYVDTVIREWELYHELLGRKIPLQEIHLGGGTPTFLNEWELEKLIQGIFKYSHFVGSEADREFGLEADPRVTTREQLKLLYDLGFRRLSLGIQDFDPKVQQIVHREQSEEQVRAVTDAAREIGYTSINFDLIYGLPLQTLASVRSTIEAVKRLSPDRIAFYGYAHVPWIKPGQRRFTEADLPAGNDKRALYELGRQLLEDQGYIEIGLDHFALPTDSLWTSARSKHLHRNFMGYIARQVAPLIGIGVSAIGDSWEIFAQNEKSVETYQKRVAEGVLPIHRGHVLSREDQVLRRHILNLMTKMETEWYGDLETEFLSGIEGRLGELERDGIVKVTKSNCVITEAGRPFMRNVCMAFDARLAKKNPDTQLFSKTI